MQIWCGDFAGSIEWAKQGIANTTDDDADLRMMLVVAYLGLGEPDEANRWLSTYLAKAAGPTAASWALYLVEDLEYVPSLASTRTERQKMAAELERCAAKSPTEEAPLEEIERLLPTAIDDMRVALHLAGGRVALEMKDRNAALRHLRGVPAEPAARLALGRLNAESVVAALAEGRLDTVRAEWSLTDDGVARMVEQFATSGTARAAAGALELLPLEHHAGILEWTATHLGLGEVALSIPALTVTIPRSLGPDRTDESKWPFLARTLPEVRRLLEDRFGITIPSILVRTEDIESIGLWIGLSKGAELPTLPAKGERIEILAAADALRRGDAREFTPHTRIAGWLLNEIGWQLSSIITVQDVADLASAEVVTPDEKSVPRVEDLVQLTRLVRSLLMEQIGVKPWLVIAEAAIANRKSSLDSALKDTRLRLTASLGGALRQAGGDDPGKLAPVPVDLELRVKAMLRNDGRNGFLAAPPEDVNAVVEGLRPLIGAAPPRILIVEDSQVRPWIRRLAGFAVANVLVFTREELAKIGVHPMETGQSRPMPAETHAV